MTDRDSITRTRARTPGVERWKLLARWCFTERMAPALNGGTVPPRRARRARQTACAGWRGKASSDMPALKPYWGKLAVRNFREGAGDVTHGRLPFATQLERADTWEATHLLVGAPVLYSTEAKFGEVDESRRARFSCVAETLRSWQGFLAFSRLRADRLRTPRLVGEGRSVDICP